MNFNVPPPSHDYREIWDYKHANIENIQKAISMFDWYKTFKNKNANEKTRILTDTLINIFKNFIPHKTKNLGCKHPEWRNSLFLLPKKERSTLKDFIKILQIIIKIFQILK